MKLQSLAGNMGEMTRPKTCIWQVQLLCWKSDGEKSSQYLRLTMGGSVRIWICCREQPKTGHIQIPGTLDEKRGSTKVPGRKERAWKRSTQSRHMVNRLKEWIILFNLRKGPLNRKEDKIGLLIASGIVIARSFWFLRQLVPEFYFRRPWWPRPNLNYGNEVWG